LLQDVHGELLFYALQNSRYKAYEKTWFDRATPESLLACDVDWIKVADEVEIKLKVLPPY
jgi:hypothetical protein